jgi:hypothetical protein
MYCTSWWITKSGGHWNEPTNEAMTEWDMGKDHMNGHEIEIFKISRNITKLDKKKFKFREISNEFREHT